MNRHEIDALVAVIAPQLDIAPSVRKLPSVMAPNPSGRPPMAGLPRPTEGSPMAVPAPLAAACHVPQPSHRRPIVQAMAPQRYRVQFTIDQVAYEKLQRLQALLRREIPDGDPATICDRAWSVLLEKVQKAKLGAVRAQGPRGAIRSGTDKVHKSAWQTRHIPRAVKRAVWLRDKGQCAFISAAGQRCREGTFLEFHHVIPHAHQGPATIANISLRCRRHNQYESDLVFGPHEHALGHEVRTSVSEASLRDNVNVNSGYP